MCVIIYLNMESLESAKETALPSQIKWCRATIANKPIFLDHLKVPILPWCSSVELLKEDEASPSSLPSEQLFIALRVF